MFNSPIKAASDTWDWLTPEDIVKHALAAYYATCRRMEQLAAMDGNTESIDRTVLAGDLHQNFGRRLQADGFTKGVCEWWSGAEAKLAEMRLETSKLDIEESQKCHG